MKKITGAVPLILVAVLFRTILHLGPNIELVTTTTILAATYLGLNYALVVPLLTMFISDTLIGNTNIYLFTWSAFCLIGAGNYLFTKKIDKTNLVSLVPAQTGFGIVAVVFFYLYTNFGVWFLDSWGMYPKTLSGLLECYFLGLPFLRWQLAGNLLFIPSSFILAEGVSILVKKKIASRVNL